MAPLTFLDSNLLAYAHDADAGTKGQRAREVLGSHDRAVVSTQVLRRPWLRSTRCWGCVLTEDLSDGQVIEGVRIVNPFQG